VCADGPLELSGALIIAGIPATGARLCRCGQSASKPFCDDSQERSGFRARGEVPPIDEPQVEAAPGRTRVQPIADGPLALWGPVRIVGDSGKTITCCNGPTLCRCGHSANKPFCDGAHAAAGFRAPA
jgi:CDGSH-type Zn-finger protein